METTGQLSLFDLGDDAKNYSTVDDLSIEIVDGYDYYGYGEHKDSETYNEIYRERIKKMDAE